ncbi:GrBNV gp23-like protein-like protein [Mauternbach virus]|uniref:GrBNV gp23-like protein-like protein n=1 Tax=Mauternbach virus TaxID=2486603 RepID=A0A3G3E627_9VIRU|nr:GrBNV gp23-like protein-like protein [Mauternbach virus]AYP97922.1 GrBNV gp23-like protein-like protein [Mauternbach virus]
MSALLANDAIEINLCAEYGYSSRQFSKYPLVYQSNDYRSCLFLMHIQHEKIENRKKNYRNHFTLFRNENSIIVCRTETSLVHTDNDAIIIYDCIIPSENVDDRLRSKYTSWNVSFDKITYSNVYPNFIGYSLVCSGEWWYYDRGIILNGVTGYEENVTCSSIFIYYELHIDYVIKMPSKDALVLMPPDIKSLTTHFPNNMNYNRLPNLRASSYGNTAFQLSDPIKPSASNVQSTVVQQQQQKTPTLPSSLINHPIVSNTIVSNNSQLPTFMYGTTSDVAGTDLNLANIQPSSSPPQISMSASNSNINASIPNANFSNNYHYQNQQQHQLNQFTSQLQQENDGNVRISSLPATLLPYINGIVRSTIRQNDTTQTPQIESHAVIPSLHWLEQRSNELRRGEIDYFLPLDYKCPTRGLIY